MALKNLDSKTKKFYIDSTIQEICNEKSDLDLYNDQLSLENERLSSFKVFKETEPIYSKLVKAREIHMYNDSKKLFPKVYSDDKKCDDLQKLLLEELWRQSGNDQLTFTDYVNDLHVHDHRLTFTDYGNGMRGLGVWNGKIIGKSEYEIHISYSYDCMFIDSIVMKSYGLKGIFGAPDKIGHNKFEINPKYEFGSNLRKMKLPEGTYIIKNEKLYRSKKDGLIYKHQCSEF
jgi:hypothetical protein